MSEQKKISLTRFELSKVMNPLWVCFGHYNQVGCGLKCSRTTHRTCRKVTLFLSRRDT